MPGIKRVVITFILLTVTVLFADIHWQKDLSSAFKKAKQEQKTVMVLVTGKHCRWCKKMKYRTLRNKKVKKRLAPYIVVEVKNEDSRALKTLPKVESVPRIFFLTADKKLIASVRGYYNTDDFIAFIDSLEQNVPLQKL